jgi:hypothetical protein
MVIEKTKKKISAEISFKTPINLSFDFFQKLCITFSFGCFQTLWTHCMYTRWHDIQAGLIYRCGYYQVMITFIRKTECKYNYVIINIIVTLIVLTPSS